VFGGVWLLTAGRGMGLGDVALAPVLGLALGWLGWGPSLVGLLGGFASGAVVGVALIWGGSAGRRTRVPYGPFMLAGAAVGMFVGQPVWSGYLHLVGVA
jgi:leader peptidase (prepilin peptidase)/N-methyltransferase